MTLIPNRWPGPLNWCLSCRQGIHDCPTPSACKCPHEEKK